MPKILVKTSNPLDIVDIQKVRNEMRKVGTYVDFNELNCSNVVFEHKNNMSYMDLALYLSAFVDGNYEYLYYEDVLDEAVV